MKLTDGKKYLKLDNVKNGDVITIKTEGEWVQSTKFTYPDGKPKNDFVVQVEVNKVVYDMRINATNRKALIKYFGDETSSWVDRKAKVNIIKGLVSGEMKDMILLEPLSENAPSVSVKADDIDWVE